MKNKIEMTKKTDLTLDEGFDLFLRKAKVKNLSELTIKTYKYHFESLTEFMDESTSLNDITSEDIDEYILYLKSKQGVKDVTVNSYLRTIRAFFYYCMECGYMTRFKIVMPRLDKEVKETYTDDELSLLLEKPDLKKCSFTEYKIWVFENYLLGTGNRISSALGVKIGDIDFEGGMILIRKSKNRKQQLIPLAKSLANILKEYIEIRGNDSENYLFCNMYGEKGCIRTFQQEVQEYNIKRNVNRTSCHVFRHTFAKHWILAGGDVFRLQKILGHHDLKMTKEYVEMFGQDLSRDFDSFNPLEKFKSNKTKLLVVMG